MSALSLKNRNGVDDAAQRVADAVGAAGKSASKTSAQVAAKSNKAAAKTSAQVAAKSSKLAAKSGEVAAKSKLRRPFAETLLKGQLLKTSRELAHEAEDLSEAVDSLNAIIKANRKAGAANRTRLLTGLALGAAIAYHLDPERGAARRAATGRRIAGAVRSAR